MTWSVTAGVDGVRIICLACTFPVPSLAPSRGHQGPLTPLFVEGRSRTPAFFISTDLAPKKNLRQPLPFSYLTVTVTARELDLSSDLLRYRS